MKCDSLDWAIIKLLQQNGRKSFAEIGRELNLSAQTVQTRYAKMKKAGIIIGSTLVFNPNRLGINCLISVEVKAQETNLPEVKKYIENLKFEDADLYPCITFGNCSLVIFGYLYGKTDNAFKLRNLIKLNPGITDVKFGLLMRRERQRVSLSIKLRET